MWGRVSKANYNQGSHVHCGGPIPILRHLPDRYHSGHRTFWKWLGCLWRRRLRRRACCRFPNGYLCCCSLVFVWGCEVLGRVQVRFFYSQTELAFVPSHGYLTARLNILHIQGSHFRACELWSPRLYPNSTLVLLLCRRPQNTISPKNWHSFPMKCQQGFAYWETHMKSTLERQGITHNKRLLGDPTEKIWEPDKKSANAVCFRRPWKTQRPHGTSDPPPALRRRLERRTPRRFRSSWAPPSCSQRWRRSSRAPASWMEPRRGGFAEKGQPKASPE